MTKLTDIQSILLSTAAQREEGSLFPLPEAFTGKMRQARTAVRHLIKRGLATETEAADREAAYRNDGNHQLAAIISDAGLQAVGVLALDAGGEPSPVGTETDLSRRVSKQAKVLELLHGNQGASIAELQETTGWLPHTTRAALTGLRKRGIQVEKTKVDGVTRYKAATAQ